MAIPLLDLRAQYATIRDSVVNAMGKVIDDQAFILGEPVERLEREVAQLSHVRHAIGVANGTDALLLALRALDIGRGDEVLTTPFTFFATAGAVHNVGARPVFADIEPDTFNISTDAITAGIKPSTKAIIAVDLFGQMAPIEAILDAAGNLPVIEDAAQSIGARRKNPAYYDAAFADLDDVRPPTVDPANESIYNQSTLRVARRDALQTHLKEQQIGSAVYYPLSLHLQPCFEYLGLKRGAFPESERATQEVISLPVFPEFAQSQFDEGLEAVGGFYGR